MQAIQTRLRELWGKLRDFFKKLNKTTQILLGAALVVVLALAIALAVKLNQKEYEVLFTGLTSNETSTVIQFLSDNGVTDYRIQGDTILVRKGRETQLQSQLIMSGNLSGAYLNHSFGTTHSGALNTSEEQKRIWEIDMEQHLQAVIERFDGVREATVDIAPGTEKIYVLEDSATPTTAAVTITPDGNRALSDAVVEAIRYTVSHAVEGLTVENVSIVDTIGSTYSDLSSTASMIGQATALKLQYEEQIRNNIRREIFNGLQSIYGPDNVTVNVLCTVDVNHKIIDETTYRQPEGSVRGGGLIIGDTVFIEQILDGETAVGGTVGTQTNSEVPNDNFPMYPDWTNGAEEGSIYQGENVDRKHVVDTTNTQEEKLVGTLTDLRLMVTVNQDCPNSGALTIDALRDSVASLAGIGGTDDVLNRVSVLIAPFHTDPNTIPGDLGGLLGFLTGENSWILYAAIGGLLLFVVLLVLILVLSARRRKQRRLQEQMTVEEEMAAAAMAAEAAALLAEAPPTGGADIMEVNTEKSMELRQEVRRFAQNNPEIAAQLVKAWLKGGDDIGG